MLLLKVTEWFEYQGSLANPGVAKYSPDKTAPPKKRLQICVKSSCAHNFWQLPQTQIKFYATEKQDLLAVPIHQNESLMSNLSLKVLIYNQRLEKKPSPLCIYPKHRLYHASELCYSGVAKSL